MEKGEKNKEKELWDKRKKKGSEGEIKEREVKNGKGKEKRKGKTEKKGTGGRERI